MTILYDYYAVDSSDIDAASSSISEALGLKLTDDEWSKRGRYFAYEGDNNLELVLLWNWNENYEGWNLPRFKNYALIFMAIEVDEKWSSEVERSLKTMDDLSIQLLERGYFDSEIGDYRFLFQIEEIERK